ncbi:MAG TPA: STAS domain-containing protein [Gaiellaceae bacterium]|nr:STAS domain-containing protein [Gaiellaceae bacterium]
MHRVEIERGGPAGAAVVHLHGEVDAFVAPELSAAFAELAGQGRVVADLTAVGFLDSTALGLLVRGVRELTEAGGEVRVVLPRGTARRIFEITALDRVLPVAESRSAALAELAG